MSIEAILDPLNAEQRAAVTSDAQHTLVIAGAGSGKTRVLVHRMAYLVQLRGVSPYNLMAVTFTNKAAGEMKERIQSMIPHAGGLWIGTFHGLALRLLRAHHDLVNLPSSFQILDAQDQLRLVKRLVKEMQLDEGQFPPKQVMAFINGHKEEGRRAHQVEAGYNPFVRKMQEVYQTYERTTQRSGLVDFAELLLLSYELLLKNPQVLHGYHQRFSHVLVDEFQDTNSLQYAWLRLLVGGAGTLFVVGDDDQSIYGWRGAKVENIQNFDKDFAQAKVLRLEQNYRSTNAILQAANSLIANNSERLGKNLWTDGVQGEPIKHFAALNEYEEAEFVVASLKDWQDQGHALTDAGILYRSNAQSRVLENQLIQQGLAYRIYGGLRFYDRAEIKDALAYARLMLNRHDDAALDRVLNNPPRGIGQKSQDELRELAARHGLTLWDAMLESLSQQIFSSRTLKALKDFMNLIDTLHIQLPTSGLHEQMEFLIHQSGLYPHLENQGKEESQSRLENLDELINAAKDFARALDDDLLNDNKLAHLGEFVAQASLDAGDAQAAANEDAVQLMTLHSAKGLEFPLVFLVGWEEGLFPSQLALENQQLEEERRLAYVGITRARQHLLISHAEQRTWHGKTLYQRPSRFVEEIPAELLQPLRPYKNTPNITRPGETYTDLPSKNPLRQAPRMSSAEKRPFHPGDRIRHNKFGDGIVLGFEGTGEDLAVSCFFDQVGKKQLLLSLAKLEKI